MVKLIRRRWVMHSKNHGFHDNNYIKNEKKKEEEVETEF